MRLCKDCKHYVPGDYVGSDVCACPALQRPPDLVRGEPRLTFCDYQRGVAMAGENRCGDEAKFFEARMP